MKKESYDLDAKVYYRESTKEWILQIEGKIEDEYIIVRHTQPGDTFPADVPSLRNLYAALDKLDQIKYLTKIVKHLASSENLCLDGKETYNSGEMVRNLADTIIRTTEREKNESE